MAIIDGKVPPPSPPRDGPRQLVVKLKGAQAGQFLEETKNLLSTRGIRPSFKPLLREEQLSPSAKRVLDAYLTLDLPEDANPDTIAEELTRRDEVETAYVAGRPCPPPVDPADDPRSTNQGFLDAAPGGIDARWAWAHSDGSGVGFVDLEQGWTLDHEDLVAASIKLIPPGFNMDYPGHGTAVLGQVLASDNAIGNIGIAPRASARVVSQWRSAVTFNTAVAIFAAADAMKRGDVLLLEAQTTIGSSTYLPVEVETAVFDAIRYAVDEGIIVVEAAGNGSNDLDSYTDSAGKRVLDRSRPEFKDSGAIMVGAATSAAPHRRLDFSNFGSRIDCFGWGQNIDTCGDGWLGTAINSYTTSFGGTSGASPIVTGAALLLQSWFVRVDGTPAFPQVIRSLLSDQATNTPSANPATDRIGAMPNLRAIIERQQRLRDFRNADHYASFVTILAGVIDDSPGIVWVPGKGPVPVDPEWGKTPVGRAQKDMLVAMLIAELSERMGDGDERQKIAVEAVKVMERSVAAIGQRLLHQ